MKKLLFAVLATAIFAISPIYAQGMMGHMQNHSQFNKAKLAKILNLTKQQIKQFQDMHYANQMKTIDLKAQIEKNRLRIKKMFTDGNINENKILSLTDENSAIQSKMKHSKVKMMLDMYKLLNKEQKPLFLKFIANKGCEMRKGKMMKMMKGKMMKKKMMGQ